MKRSDIDAAIDRARALAAKHQVALPPFARWPRAKWLARPELVPTMLRGIGWDVTDFGRGDFPRYGLTLCTLRNGSLEERDAGIGETSAEKLMMVEVGQETPFHLHLIKTEDIINRSGGRLRLELYPVTWEDDSSPVLGAGTVRTFVSGIVTDIEAGESVILEPGESVQVPVGYYHRFWAIDDPVLAAEVSSVNDDAADNVFLVKSPRYPAIEEDAPAKYLIVGDYPEVLAATPGQFEVPAAQAAARARLAG